MSRRAWLPVVALAAVLAVSGCRRRTGPDPGYVAAVNRLPLAAAAGEKAPTGGHH